MKIVPKKDVIGFLCRFSHPVLLVSFRLIYSSDFKYADKEYDTRKLLMELGL
jgi:hypothetical protein